MAGDFSLVHDTDYGLAACVYRGLDSALRIGERVEGGMIGVNRGVVSTPATPFAGLKHSGIGREDASGVGASTRRRST